MVPRSPLGWSYLAEGNANVIFSRVGEEKLLRLRKSSRNEQTTQKSKITASTVVDNHKRIFRRLFADEHLVHHELVPVARQDIELLNHLLHAMDEEGKRPANRRGSRLDEYEEHGILITAMLQR